MAQNAKKKNFSGLFTAHCNARIAASIVTAMLALQALY